MRPAMPPMRPGSGPKGPLFGPARDTTTFRCVCVISLAHPHGVGVEPRLPTNAGKAPLPCRQRAASVPHTLNLCRFRAARGLKSVRINV